MNKGKLILTRKNDESFILRLSDDIDPSTPVGEIFDEIKITLRECPHQVKVLVEADQCIKIMRSELLEQTEYEN